MSTAIALATSRRVATQLRRDRRTMALLLVVPAGLLALLDYVFEEQPDTMARVGPPLIGLLPLIMMFLITSSAMLRERTTGSLERLMSMPMSKVDLLAGYGFAFALVAAVQATITGLVGFGLLGIDAAGPAWAIVLLAAANAVLGTALGLFLSAFATSEFQAVQFLPAFVFPQLLLIGLFVPRPRLPGVLDAIATFLPMTYAYEALAKVAADELDGGLWLDLGIVAGCVVAALVIGATTLKRRTP